MKGTRPVNDGNVRVESWARPIGSPVGVNYEYYKLQSP